MSVDASAPCGARRASRSVIQPQVTFPHLREKNDLPCVHREVFDHREDGLHDRDVVTLNAAMFEQSHRINRRKHAVRFRERCAKVVQQ